jgi:hypothetical protein
MRKQVWRQSQIVFQLTVAGIACHQFGKDTQAIGIGKGFENGRCLG